MATNVYELVNYCEYSPGSDIKVKSSDGKILYFYKSVLCKNSEVFNAMLNSPLVIDSEIEWDATSEIINFLLNLMNEKYIYSHFSEDELTRIIPGVVRLCDKYEFLSVVKFMEDYPGYVITDPATLLEMSSIPIVIEHMSSSFNHNISIAICRDIDLPYELIGKSRPYNKASWLEKLKKDNKQLFEKYANCIISDEVIDNWNNDSMHYFITDNIYFDIVDCFSKEKAIKFMKKTIKTFFWKQN